MEQALSCSGLLSPDTPTRQRRVSSQLGAHNLVHVSQVGGRSQVLESPPAPSQDAHYQEAGIRSRFGLKLLHSDMGSGHLKRHFFFF